jgi:two-component system sensor kinase FixL
MKDPLSIFAASNRQPLIAVAGVLVAAIAFVDWATKPFISLGFLYLFPIMMMGGFLPRAQIVAVALVCAVLQEAFSNLPGNEGVARLLFSSAGFVGTGLFVSELIRNRRAAMTHVEVLEGEIKLRQDAEEQLRSLVETSPAAIVTIGSEGRVLLANEAAQKLLAPGGTPLQGQAIGAYLPSLETVVKTQPTRSYRTALQCTGQRLDAEVFLAGVWFSTYSTVSGPRVAAIIVDLSEDLRSREDLSLNQLLKSTRVLMSAVAHEISNLCGAVLVVHKNLSRVKELESNEDFRALGGLIQSLDRVSALELGSTSARTGEVVELTSLLDEFRILIETPYREAQIELEWDIEGSLPSVWADRYGLIQVFVNLAKNSQRAMTSTERKRLRVSAKEEGRAVVLRFEDTGTGIAAPEHLFTPFLRGADSTGLGLYVSRVIMRGFGGDLSHEPRAEGCCFALVLPVRASAEDVLNA